MANTPPRYAMICASNMNRSMAAHNILLHHGYRVDSYGTGKQVKLPGRTQQEAVSFEFGTKYADIYKQLVEKDEKLYAFHGIDGSS